MPYIKQGERDKLKQDRKAETVGQLTYLYTRALIESSSHAVATRLEAATYKYLPTREARHFSDYAEVLGALNAARLEFMRRNALTLKDQQRLLAVEQFTTHFYLMEIAPYEDSKMRENGDVYGEEAVSVS